MLLFHGRRTTFNAGVGVRSGFTRGAGLVTFVTMLYPVAWGLSEGGNVISPTREMIFYGILDLVLGPVFLYYFVWGLRKTDYGLFGLHSGKYTDGPHGTGSGSAGFGRGNGVGGNAISGNGVGNNGMTGAHGIGHNNMTNAGPGSNATAV